MTAGIDVVLQKLGEVFKMFIYLFFNPQHFILLKIPALDNLQDWIKDLVI